MLEIVNSESKVTETQPPTLKLKKLVLRDLSTPMSPWGLNRSNQQTHKSDSLQGDSVVCGCCC